MQPFILHLMRHGATEISGHMMGRTDVAPTPEGIAACVAHVQGLGIETVISSDLSRAHLAATAIGDALGVPVTIDPRWREIDFGDWDGLPTRKIDLTALSQFWEDPDANPPPSGERWSSLTARVSTALAELVPRTTLVVAHGGSMRAALASLFNFSQRDLWAFDLPCGALLSLKIWRDEQGTAQIIGLWP